MVEETGLAFTSYRREKRIRKLAPQGGLSSQYPGDLHSGIHSSLNGKAARRPPRINQMFELGRPKSFAVKETNGSTALACAVLLTWELDGV